MLVPPAPTQVKVYVVVASKATLSVPMLVALLPLQVPPLAEQEVALTAFQLNCTTVPVTAVETPEDKVMTGGLKTTETP
jgi:hypothetical protein